MAEDFGDDEERGDAREEQPRRALALVRDGDEPDAAEPAAPAVPQPSAGLVPYGELRQPGERRPIIPAPVRRENLRATLSALAGVNWHRARYHGLRFPAYLLALVLWALAGLIRVVSVQARWAWLHEQTDLRTQAADAGDSREWHRLHREAKETRKTRGYMLLAEAIALAIGVWALIRFGTVWVWSSAGLAAALILARLGRPEGHRIVSPAVVPPEYEVPTPVVITRGLGSLGISKIDRAISDGRGIQFVSDVMRDGPGWGVHVDLPFGVTSAMILARRRELASGLRRPLSAVWPEGVPAEHEGRLSLWIGFQDMAKTRPPKWPLLKAGTADLFAGIPFGTDPRQRPVTAPLFEANWLIGSSPGNGKTSAVRVLGLSAALDIRTDLLVHELAGKGDLEPLAQVSHRYCSGLNDDAIAYAADSLRILRAELERRAQVFGKLPKEAKPDGKVTPELAARGFRLKVAIFDEAQNMLMHPEHGPQAADDAAYVIRLGRAYGIIVILATQRPDKDSLPTAISGLVTMRFCLKVPDYLGNDMILGTGAYKAGYNAVIFRHQTDAGLGWLRGDADPQIVRTYYLDLPAAAKVAGRARAMRERAGVLSGYALGMDEDEIASPRDVLADVLDCFRAGENGLQWGELADRLAERYPARWADLTGEAISAECRNKGVKSVDVNANGRVLKGCRRVGVERAAGR